MNASVAGPNNRYRSLDHWRGFAALWVLIFHAFNAWIAVSPHFLPPLIAAFCWHGWLGAHIFFVISGYCIAERTAREFRLRGSVRLFFTDRLLRIFPPYWAALAFTLILNLLAQRFNATADNPSPGGWLDAIASVSASELWWGRPSYLLVAWTLSYEIGFYLIAALCLGCALTLNRAWPGYLLASVLFVAAFFPSITNRVPLLQLWPHFALGGLVWLLVQHVPHYRPRLWRGTLLLGLVAAYAWWHAPAVDTTLLFVAGCAWLLLLLQPADDRMFRSPALRWLGWIGTFSYSLYLVHAPIVSKFRNLFSRHWQPMDPGAVWVPVAACGLAVAVAWLFYQQVELRTEAWRKSFLRRRSYLK